MKSLILNSKVISVGIPQSTEDRLLIGGCEFPFSTIQGYSIIECPSEVNVGWSYNGSTFSPPTPVVPPKVVPFQVTRRQAKQALALAGKIDLIEPAINAIPDATARKLALIEWQDSLDFQRNRPLVVQLGASLGLTSEALDDLFILASTL